MATTLNFKPGAFDMVSRVGRQIDEKLNSKEVFERLIQPVRKLRQSPRARDRKLISPQALIELLDQQEAASPPTPSTQPHPEKPDENFLFRKQSRLQFYRATVKAS